MASSHTSSAELPRVIGRYALCDRIAAGGMATVHLGRLLGPAGFGRTVAVKRLHPQYAQDSEFVSMFLDEARLAARIRHPNVVPTLDVVATGGELFIVMEYVQGESLARLIRVAAARGERVPVAVASSIVAAVLHGLHAAHEATGEGGEPLGIVHRDVSPQNVLVGADGMARVLDFGVAKAAGRIQTTREGQLKGKLAYMAPEQIGGAVTRATDVYAASVVLWETLTGRRLFAGDSEAAVMKQVLDGRIAAPSDCAPGIPAALDRLALRGLAGDPSERFQTAEEMALALEDAVPLVPPSRIGAWVQAAARETLNERSDRVAAIESDSAVRAPRPPPPPPRSSTPEPARGDERIPQPSSGSILVSAQPSNDARRRSWPGLVGAAVLGALLAVGLLATALAVRPHPTPGAPPAASAAVSLAAAPPAPSPAAAAASAITPPAAPSAAPLQPLAEPPAAPSTRPPAHAPAAARPAGTRNDCDPPWYFNARHNRVFKRECL